MFVVLSITPKEKFQEKKVKMQVSPNRYPIFYNKRIKRESTERALLVENVKWNVIS